MIFLVLALILLASCSQKKPPSGERETVYFGGANKLAVDEFSANYRVMCPEEGTPHNPVFASEGKILWHKSIGRVSTKNLLSSSPVICGDYVVTQDIDTHVSVFTKNGELVWRKCAGNPRDPYKIGGGIAAINETIVVSLPSGEVVCYNLLNGEEKWRTNLAEKIRSAPSINGRFCFVTTLNSQLVCLNLEDGGKRWTDVAQKRPTSLVGGPAPLLINGNVIAPQTSGEVNALRQENGHVHWRTMVHAESEMMVLEEFLSWYAPLVYEAPRLYIAHPAGSLVVLDIRTGAEEWKLNASYLCAPALSENTIFSLDISGYLVCANKEKGRVMWLQALPDSEQWFGPVLAGSSLILLGTGGSMLVVDPTKGDVVKNVKLSKHAFIKPPVVEDGVMYAIDQQGELFAVT